MTALPTLASTFELIARNEAKVLDQWLAERGTLETRAGRVGDDLRQKAKELLRALIEGAATAREPVSIAAPEWNSVRDVLDGFSRSRAREGYAPSETATLVFSLKRPLFSVLSEELRDQPAALASATWQTTLLLDEFGLYTTEVYQKGREEVIARQQQEMLELSTPVVELWESVLALPLIGTLDSARTSVVMENLLQRIVETGAQIAIIDITGVPMVDTLVAQHLLKTVAAARLMGADCIISGIRPQIAQTLVHLGVALNEVVTKATLADAFAVALRRTGRVVKRVSAEA